MHERRRVLVVIDGMEVGGSQRQIQQLLACLDPAHWEPELAYFRCDSHLVEAIRNSGIPVHYLPKRRRIDLPFLLAFARLLRRRDYALVHAFSLTAELWAVLARGLAGRSPPLIASERSFYLAKPAWHWLLKRIVFGASTAVIANSAIGARSTALRTRMPQALFATVANGVELPARIDGVERAALRAELGVPETRAMGLFVGRLVAVKNLPCLVRALASLPSAQRPWMGLAGGGPLRDELEELAARLGVAEDIGFLGERRDVPRLLQAVDFLVLPSHFEGQSNAVLEAMAAGCPVIASNVGGTPELVHDGRTGLLFPTDDADALAASMSRLVSEPDLRMRLARSAREHVATNHSPAALADATSAVYERCLGIVAPIEPPSGECNECVRPAVHHRH
ncbi:MAG: glycosyltransferase [Pseudomonadota bacterium]|nr:glycosyltransferase [Pseudomonadota bacterium]